MNKVYMQLLTEDKLIWSPIVANSRMNRARRSSGINSYEKEFKFKPEIFLQSRIAEYDHASWLDLCCGEGNALIQAANYFYEQDQQSKVVLKGVDLLNMFQPTNKNISCLHLESASVVGWKPDQDYDLITCSHGLHYLGNKLQVVETAIGALLPTGVFIANLDLNNIAVDGTIDAIFLKSLFKKSGVAYNSKTKIISRPGFMALNFGVIYIGADDTYGPNYTRQDSVTSYYLSSQ